MPISDRLGWMLLGAGIGFVFGYIVRVLQDIQQKVDDVEQIVKHDHDGEGGFMRKPVVADVLMLLVVALTAWAAFMSQAASNDVKENYKQDKINTCQSSVENRDVLRSLVEAIFGLATGSIDRAPGSPPLTTQQVEQYNAYINRVNDFREQMYTKIKPTELCAPYINKEPTKPPTPPFPLIPIPKR